jgi:hypothetical protein
MHGFEHAYTEAEFESVEFFGSSGKSMANGVCKTALFV